MNVSIIKRFKLVFCLAFLIAAGSFPSSVFAEQKALLVSVGKYLMPNKDLPGMEVDMELTRETLLMLGFEPHQIKSLLNEQATYANIKEQMTGWLREGVKKDDKIVFYFSGHGTRIRDTNGDEKDNVDEVLMTHDAKLVTRDKYRTLENVIVDDTFAEWIADIPSENVYVFVDACNSGTITRGTPLSNLSIGESEAYSKFAYYPGMPMGDGASFSKIVNDEPEISGSNNFVAISATQDHEQALTTSKGSFFTLGLNEYIRNALKNSIKITFEQLHEGLSRYITNKVPAEMIYHPQIHGSKELIKSEFNLDKTTEGYGTQWDFVESLSNKGDGIKMKLNQEQYKINDVIIVKVESEFDGYLNIISIDSNDNATILFPNKYSKNNRIEKGISTFPTENLPFKLVAIDPAGPTHIAAFVTKENINLFEMTTSGRNEKGEIEGVFTDLSGFARVRLSNAFKSYDPDQPSIFNSQSFVFSINK